MRRSRNLGPTILTTLQLTFYPSFGGRKVITRARKAFALPCGRWRLLFSLRGHFGLNLGKMVLLWSNLCPRALGASGHCALGAFGSPLVILHYCPKHNNLLIQVTCTVDPLESKNPCFSCSFPLCQQRVKTDESERTAL